jgi:hypothetical protein
MVLAALAHKEAYSIKPFLSKQYTSEEAGDEIWNVYRRNNLSANESSLYSRLVHEEEGGDVTSYHKKKNQAARREKEDNSSKKNSRNGNDALSRDGLKGISETAKGQRHLLQDQSSSSSQGVSQGGAHGDGSEKSYLSRLMERQFASSSTVRDYNQSMPYLVIPSGFATKKGVTMHSDPGARVKGVKNAASSSTSNNNRTGSINVITTPMSAFGFSD